MSVTVVVAVKTFELGGGGGTAGATGIQRSETVTTAVMLGTRGDAKTAGTKARSVPYAGNSNIWPRATILLVDGSGTEYLCR